MQSVQFTPRDLFNNHVTNRTGADRHPKSCFIVSPFHQDYQFLQQQEKEGSCWLHILGPFHRQGLLMKQLAQMYVHKNSHPSSLFNLKAEWETILLDFFMPHVGHSVVEICLGSLFAAVVNGCCCIFCF